jgi:hypothetical protein
MTTGVAIMIHGPSHDFPGATVFVFAVVLLIVLILVRVYAGGNRSPRRTAHSARHVPERDGNHGRRAVSRRRPNRP